MTMHKLSMHQPTLHKRMAPPPSYSTPERIRYYVYTYCIIIGVPKMLISWYFVQQSDAFARLVYPLLAVYCAWALSELLRAKRPLQRTERTTLMVLGVVWIARAIHAVFTSPSDSLAASLQSIYFSYVLFCILTYLMFDNRAALKLSAVAFFSSILFSIAQYLFGPVQSNFAQLFEFQGYLAVSIGLIHALSYFKSELSESKAKAAAFEELAFKDSLTGLHNRRRLYSDLQNVFAIAQRYERPLSVILIDIDHFKRINDNHGHDVGDLILKEFALLITPLLRQGNTWGRWGGEEFLIICPETSLKGANTFAERLCKTIATHSFPKVGHVTASLGISSVTDNPNIEQLLKTADEKLYGAKAAGRNQVKGYLKDSSLNPIILEKKQLSSLV